jgi:hypothetical protein
VQLSLSLPYMKNCCNIFEAYIASFKYELNLIIIIIHMIEQRLLMCPLHWHSLTSCWHADIWAPRPLR